MIHLRKQKQPVRLHKKEDKINELMNEYKYIIDIMKDPSFWIIIMFIIIFIFAISFAINESISYFVYNNGGI